jgi:hypothetical protein
MVALGIIGSEWSWRIGYLEPQNVKKSLNDTLGHVKGE